MYYWVFPCVVRGEKKNPPEMLNIKRSRDETVDYANVRGKIMAHRFVEQNVELR